MFGAIDCGVRIALKVTAILEVYQL